MKQSDLGKSLDPTVHSVQVAWNSCPSISPFTCEDCAGGLELLSLLQPLHQGKIFTCEDCAGGLELLSLPQSLHQGVVSHLPSFSVKED